MGLVIAVLLSVITGLLANEISARIPRITVWLIDLSVRQLPPSEQDRYREEWLSHYHDMPNSLARLLHAFSLLAMGVSRKLAADWSSQRLDLIGSNLRALQYEVKKSAMRLDELSSQTSDRTYIDRLLSVAKKSLRDVDDIIQENENISVENGEKIKSIIRSHIENIEDAAVRSHDLLDRRASEMRDRVQKVNDQLALAAEEYDRAYQLNARGKLTPNLHDEILKRLYSHLVAAHQVKVDPEEPALAEESHRLIKLLDELRSTSIASLVAQTQTAPSEDSPPRRSSVNPPS